MSQRCSHSPLRVGLCDCLGSLGVKQVNCQRQRIDELAPCGPANVSDQPPDTAPVEALEMACVLREHTCGRAPGQKVVFQRNLDDDSAGDPYHLLDERNRRYDVFEYVRADGEIE